MNTLVYHELMLKKNKCKFSQEEDDKLAELVRKFGPKNWKMIAEGIPSRSARQLRERWINYLDPNVNRTDWTPEEDELLIQKESEIGPRWSTLCQLFNGRTDIAVKNRFTLLQRRIAKRQRNLEKQPKPQRRAVLLSLPAKGRIVLNQNIFPCDFDATESENLGSLFGNFSECDLLTGIDWNVGLE